MQLLQPGTDNNVNVIRVLLSVSYVSCLITTAGV